MGDKEKELSAVRLQQSALSSPGNLKLIFTLICLLSVVGCLWQFQQLTTGHQQQTHSFTP